MRMDEVCSPAGNWLSPLVNRLSSLVGYSSCSPEISSLSQIWLSIPLFLRITLVLLAAVAFVLASTRLYTTYRYQRALAALLSANTDPETPLSPPRIPYTLPFLGSGRDFLAPKPGLFWNYLFSFHPRYAGACTLRLGPRTAHILHDASAVQALFKTRDANRLEFNIQIARTSLGVPNADLMKYHGTDSKDKHIYSGPKEDNPLHVAEQINMDTLIKTNAVNELTAEFSRQFKTRVEGVANGEEIELLTWLRREMFDASGKALLGEKVLEYYPEFRNEFWDFDRHMLELFFGLPEWMVPAAVNARDTCVKGLIKWHEGMAREGLDRDNIVDSNGHVSWEPNYGSRANRARQEMYDKFGLSLKARAGFDLGFTFGLASNAIPATAWMLLHILDPRADKSLLPRVMAELKSARNPDGTLNLPILFGLPLMNSIFHEVLRLYTDVLVSRILEKDHTIPIGNLKDRKVLLKKNTLAFAPAWVGQRDPNVWEDAPTFRHERFLTTDPETGKDVFTTNGTAGRFFPFGGGKSVCPGRAFAKQEIFAATAMMLLNFDIEVVDFVDGKGRVNGTFPGLRDGFGGSGIVMPAGDVKLRLRKREN